MLLEDQDRSRWDHAAIDEGSRLVDDALRGSRPGERAGRFTLQAAIAALHDEATSADDTDWRHGRVEEEGVWRKAIRRVATEGITPERAVDEAVARVRQILSE